MRNRDAIALILILFVTALAIWIDFAPDNTWLGRDVSTRLGLDLQGGTQVLLRAQPQTDLAVTADEMQTAARIIEQRVNGLGVSEAVVQRSGNDRIIVELPGVRDPEQAIQTIRSTGQLEFIDPQGQYLQPGIVVRTSNNPNPPALQNTTTPTGTTGLTETGTLTSTGTLTDTLAEEASGGPTFTSITLGTELNSNEVQPIFGNSQNISSGQFAVQFSYRGQSATSLEQWTAQNIGQPMCIVLDNRVQSCATVQNTLVGGSGQITTGTREEAESIYQQLKYGALPVQLGIESSRTVSASLGQDSVDASLIAGIVGLIAVMLFLILYYRLLGVLSVIVLLIYTALVFAIYRVVPVTLTLAGIAGFILSIGVIVDANVLIAGRVKEELRHGRAFRSAIDYGFSHAWSAILDSSIAMLITAVILFFFGNSFGVSIIRGFAVTLFLGTIISLVVARFVTPTFLRLLGRTSLVQNAWLLGFSPRSATEGTQTEAVA